MPDEINKQASEPAPSDSLFPRPWKSQQAQALFQAAIAHAEQVTTSQDQEKK